MKKGSKGSKTPQKKSKKESKFQKKKQKSKKAVKKQTKVQTKNQQHWSTKLQVKTQHGQQNKRKYSEQENKQAQKQQTVKKKTEKKLPCFQDSVIIYSKEQIVQIIDLYTENGGDFKYFKQKMPNFQDKQVRNCLRIIFAQTLQFIYRKMKQMCPFTVTEWNHYEYSRIIRQLQKIRNTNRLMPQSKMEIREAFSELMKILFQNQENKQMPELNLQGKGFFEHQEFGQKVYICFEQFQKFVRAKCRARLPVKEDLQSDEQENVEKENNNIKVQNNEKKYQQK